MDLSEQGFGYHSCLELAKIIKKNSHFVKYSFSKNTLSDKGANILISAFK